MWKRCPSKKGSLKNKATPKIKSNNDVRNHTLKCIFFFRNNLIKRNVKRKKNHFYFKMDLLTLSEWHLKYLLRLINLNCPPFQIGLSYDLELILFLFFGWFLENEVSLGRGSYLRFLNHDFWENGEIFRMNKIACTYF